MTRPRWALLGCWHRRWKDLPQRSRCRPRHSLAAVSGSRQSILWPPPRHLNANPWRREGVVDGSFVHARKGATTWVPPRSARDEADVEVWSDGFNRCRPSWPLQISRRIVCRNPAYAGGTRRPRRTAGGWAYDDDRCASRLVQEGEIASFARSNRTSPLTMAYFRNTSALGVE